MPKIERFLGEAPKLAAELLPETVAQTASNLRLLSGDLVPYNDPTLQFALTKTGTIQTIYPLVNADTSFGWLHWTQDVDVARAQVQNDTTQRIYYTGESEPRVTNFNLATNSGATNQGAFPLAYYTLGFPQPLTAPTVAAVSFTTLVSVSRSRDSGNVATIVTSAHGLNTGAYVTVSSMGGTGYNLTNVQVTVLSSTSFSYFSLGAAEGVTADVAGRIDIAGTTQARTYLYTWYTAWGEESVPSPVSTTAFVKEGQTINLTALPASWPHGGTYQTTGMIMNVYRTVSGTTGSLYYLVGTRALDGGTTKAVTQRVRAANVSTLTTAAAHGLTTGDTITVTLSTGGTYDVVGVTITVLTPTTFSYPNVAANDGPVADAALRYQLVTAAFVDNIPVTSLTVTLPSTNWNQPNSAMVGIKAIHNNMMVGFFGNTLCFCEPSFPHAWPIRYRIQLTDTIVAVGNFGTSLVVLTTGRPWLVQGSSPTSMNKVQMDYILPCSNKRSVVNMGFGVCWASPGGLAMYSSQTGGQFMTMFVHSWESWKSGVDFDSMYGRYYNNKYFACHDTGTFMFERDEKIGGYLTSISQRFTAGFYNEALAQFFFVDDIGTGPLLYLWDGDDEPYMSLDWHSKNVVAKEPVNYGAARVIADYNDSANSDALNVHNAAIIALNQATINANIDVGAFGHFEFGEAPVAFALIPLLEATGVLQYQLYVDNVLVFTHQVTDALAFRLPTGYRSDRVSHRISGNTRVREIHYAETPDGLRKV